MPEITKFKELKYTMDEVLDILSTKAEKDYPELFPASKYTNTSFITDAGPELFFVVYTQSYN